MKKSISNFKQFHTSNGKSINGGHDNHHLPSGWTVTHNADGTHTYTGPNGSSYTQLE